MRSTSPERSVLHPGQLEFGLGSMFRIIQPPATRMDACNTYRERQDQRCGDLRRNFHLKGDCIEVSRGLRGLRESAYEGKRNATSSAGFAWPPIATTMYW